MTKLKDKSSNSNGTINRVILTALFIINKQNIFEENKIEI